MFNKSPANLWNAVFNVPQGLTMTVAVSLFVGQMGAVALIRTFFCAYCAGVMLTAFLQIPRFGAWVTGLFRCGDKPLAAYLIGGLAGGGLMGVLMNFFMTMMTMGPVAAFPGAFWHTLGFSVLVSALSSCAWVWMVDRLVARVYGEKTPE